MKTNLPFAKKHFRVSFGLVILITFLASASVRAADGSLDLMFGTNGTVITDLGSNTDSGNAVMLQPDGKIVMAGSAQLDETNPYHRTPIIIRYQSNGAVDTSFGANGSVITEIGTFSGSKIAIQPDGKLIVAGSSQGDFAAVRFNNNGSLDTSFGQNGIAILQFSADSSERCTDVAIQTDGRIILAGYEEIGNFVHYAIARFNIDGTPDTTFSSKGIVIAEFPNSRYNYGEAVEIQADGKIIMSGSLTANDAPNSAGYGPRISLARFNEDGSLDTTFGVQGTVTTEFSNFQNSAGALVIQTDGRIVVAGTSFNTTNDLSVARFNSNGTLDTSFGGSGIVVTDFGHNESGNSLVIQSDARIIAVGNINDTNFADFMLARFNSDGSLDNTFGSNGKLISDFGNNSDYSAGSTAQLDKKIIVTGSSSGDAILARYDTNTSSTPPVTVTFRSTGDYDGLILESSENSSTGGVLDKLATTLNVGDDSQDRQYRSILSFNTSSLPDNALVTSAQLNIKRQGLVGTDPFTTHGNLLLDIRNGTFSNNVALQLDDFAASASEGAVQDLVLANTFSWYTANLSTNNLSLVNKSGVTQFRLSFSLDDNDNLSADYMKFFSGDAGEADQPQLVITYVIAPPTMFGDVSTSFWASSWIESLYNAGITGGCSTVPLNYCPDSSVTRAQMAVFLLKGMHGSVYTPPAVGISTGFTDVATDYWAAAWIKQLAAEGITGGCGAGIYCPDETVTRAQMAVFLLKAKHTSAYTPPASAGIFTDVSTNYWASAWIEQLASEGITSGCGASIYCPNDSVSRAQMAVFLVKAFNLP